MGCSSGKYAADANESKDSPKNSNRGTGTSVGSTFDPDAVLVGRINHEKFIIDNTGKIEEYYEILHQDVLGKGSYGSVRKGTSKGTSAVRAVKKLSKTHTRYNDYVRLEGKIMKLMDHPNVIRLFEIFEDSRHVFFVMELCAGGGLVEAANKNGGYFSEPQVACLMRQLLRTVLYMHKKGICHRDLKPENFLLLTKDPIEKNVLKIIDFGVSCTFEQGQEMRDKAGTPYYTSPQVLEGRYSEACDLWSCGVIMYIMLSGEPPFPGTSDQEVWANVKRGNFAFPPESFGQVSEDAKNLIRGLMKYKENLRFTPLEALKHQAIERYAPRGKDVKLRASIINSLRNFAFSTKFKKAALYAVVQISREDEISAVRDVFLALDGDDDGFVTEDEISAALIQAGLQVPADLADIVGEVDVNSTGAICYTEFLAATLDESYYVREDRCWAAFLLFDRDRDGKISQEELEMTLGDPDALSTSNIMAPQAVADVLREADLNGDGAIDFQEFMQMIKKGCTFGSPQKGASKHTPPRTASGGKKPSSPSSPKKARI